MKGHMLLPTGPGGWSFCSCGYKTGPVHTFTQQKEWHRAHRRLARVEEEAAKTGPGERDARKRLSKAGSKKGKRKCHCLNPSAAL